MSTKDPNDHAAGGNDSPEEEEPPPHKVVIRVPKPEDDKRPAISQSRPKPSEPAAPPSKDSPTSAQLPPNIPMVTELPDIPQLSKAQGESETALGAPIGTVVLSAGGAITTFATLLLPWWKRTTFVAANTSRLAPPSLLGAHTYRGLQAWPGIATFVLGLAILGAAIALSLRRDPELQVNVAAGVIFAAAIALIVCLYASLEASSAVPAGGFIVKTQLGPYGAMLGAAVSIVGGYMQLRLARSRGG